MQEDLQAGVNSWVVDTGSGHNLVPRSGHMQEELEGLRDYKTILRLSTTNGIIQARQVTNSLVTGLGETFETRVLEQTPRVLSVQQLVDKLGATFVSDDDRARLSLGGKVYTLPVKQGVPLLALPCWQ